MQEKKLPQFNIYGNLVEQMNEFKRKWSGRANENNANFHIVYQIR